jgi:hypothetical protein
MRNTIILLLQKITKLNFIDIFVWFEAVFLLGIARFLVWALPFKYWVKFIGQPMSTSNVHEQTHIKQKSLCCIQWAIKSAAYRVPWQAVCLPQAMAAKWMLGFRGQPSKLTLGLKPDPQKNNKLAAHAWLECGQCFVTGKTEEKFTGVSHFI